MNNNLEQVNIKLSLMDEQVHSDFMKLSYLKKHQITLLKKLREDRIKQKINKEEFVNYKKQVKQIIKTEITDISNQTNIDLSYFKYKYDEMISENNKLKKMENKKIKFFKFSPKVFAIIALILIPIFMTIGLTLNYLLVAPINFSKSDQVIGFSISIFIIIVDLIFLFFICKNSTKRMMLDRYNSAFKICPIGFIASFCDVLGIGSFATNTNLLKVTKSIKDDKTLPGTLNAGMAISNLFTGCLFIGAVDVEMSTLVPFVICAVLGSFIGSKIVNLVNTRIVQLIMGIVLAFTAIIMLMTVKGIEVLPSGTSKGVFEIWWKFIIGCLAFIVLGIFMSFGVGLYAPAMAIISLLGIDFLVVFPIMTCSAGLTMHVNAYRYYKDNNYLPKTSFCMTLGGIVGVITSFSLIFVGLGKGLGVSTSDIKSVFQWLSVPVISYASFLLLWSYVKSTKKLKKQNTKESINLVIDYKNFDSYIHNYAINSLKEISVTHKIDTKKELNNNNLTIMKWI